jgi:hypothetical protein
LLRCLPDGAKIETLFKTQETVGFGAWDEGRCIGQLQAYRIAPSEGDAVLWPLDVSTIGMPAALPIFASLMAFCFIRLMSWE